MYVKCPNLSSYGRFCSFSSGVDHAEWDSSAVTIILFYQLFYMYFKNPRNKIVNFKCILKMFHKYYMVIFENKKKESGMCIHKF